MSKRSRKLRVKEGKIAKITALLTPRERLKYSKLLNVVSPEHLGKLVHGDPKQDKRDELFVVAASYTAQTFYRTPEWRSLRYRVLKEQGACCVLCGASPRTGAAMHVDHIQPRSLYPELAFDIDNLQILCEACNLGKSNKDATNWKDGGDSAAPVPRVIRRRAS